MKNMIKKAVLTLAIVCLLSVSLSSQIFATTIFSDGFESGDTNAWSRTAINGGVTMTVDAVATHHGNYGLKISGLDGNVNFDHSGICGKDLLVPQIFLYTRLYVQFTQELSTGMLYIIQHTAFGGGINHACLVREVTGEYKWMIEMSNDTGVITDYFGSAFNGPIAGKWYCLELYTYKSATIGQVTLWVDGVQVINQTGIDTGALSLTEFRAEAWHIWGNPNAGTVYIDDVTSADSYIGTGSSGLSITISPSSANLVISGTQIFTSTASGGISPYTYQWYLNSVLQTTITSSYTYTATSNSIYSLYCKVTDSASATATSNTATINVGSTPNNDILAQIWAFVVTINTAVKPLTDIAFVPLANLINSPYTNVFLIDYPLFTVIGIALVVIAIVLWYKGPNKKSSEVKSN